MKGFCGLSNSAEKKEVNISITANITELKLNNLYLNIRSIKNRLDELNCFLKANDTELHVIALTETWLYSNEVAYYNIPNYEWFA